MEVLREKCGGNDISEQEKSRVASNEQSAFDAKRKKSVDMTTSAVEDFDARNPEPEPEPEPVEDVDDEELTALNLGDFDGPFVSFKVRRCRLTQSG